MEVCGNFIWRQSLNSIKVVHVTGSEWWQGGRRGRLQWMAFQVGRALTPGYQAKWLDDLKYLSVKLPNSYSGEQRGERDNTDIFRKYLGEEYYLPPPSHYIVIFN